MSQSDYPVIDAASKRKFLCDNDAAFYNLG